MANHPQVLRHDLMVKSEKVLRDEVLIQKITFKVLKFFIFLMMHRQKWLWAHDKNVSILWWDKSDKCDDNFHIKLDYNTLK